MIKTQSSETPVGSYKQNHEYREDIEEQYKQFKISQSKFGLHNNIIKTTNPEIPFYPRMVYWWLATFDTVIDSNKSGYEIFSHSINLRQLYDSVELSCHDTKAELKIAVLIGIKIGVIRSDNITVTDNPIEETGSLSDEGTETIKLADPRENPHIYINEDYANQYLTFVGWREIWQDIEYSYPDGVDNPICLHERFPTEYNWDKYFKEENVNITQLVRESVAQAAIGMGESAGVVEISSDFVKIPLKYVFVLKDHWSEIESGDGVADKGDIIRTLDRYRDSGGGEFYFKVFKFMNIIYPDDETEGGFCLNDPTTNEGPELNDVNIQRCKHAMTYDPPESQPESSELDAYAVDQFIDAHTTVGTEDESGTMRVPVDQLMGAFDVWAALNDVPLDDLGFDQAINNRKGKMKKLLIDNWNIEKASARMDGDIVRVYRPLALDSVVTKLGGHADTIA